MHDTNLPRRDALRIGGVLGLALAAGLITPAEAFAADWNKKAFEVKSFSDAVKALGGTTPAQSKDIVLDAPEIAEDGRVVPMAVESKIPKTEQIAFLVDKNPSILAASFTIAAGVEPKVRTELKLGESSTVYALVKADGKWFVASKDIKVTVGGCGG